MKQTIRSAALGGSIAAIPSKSQAHRLLICAALAEIPSRVLCRGTSADIQATVRCLQALSADIRPVPGGFSVEPVSGRSCFHSVD